jgi:hypothetical protein
LGKPLCLARSGSACSLTAAQICLRTNCAASPAPKSALLFQSLNSLKNKHQFELRLTLWLTKVVVKRYVRGITYPLIGIDPIPHKTYIDPCFLKIKNKFSLAK